MQQSTPLGAHSPLINHDVIQVLEEEGCDPIRVLARIANGSLDMVVNEAGDTVPVQAEIGERLSAAKELAQYLHPKKKALDLRSSGKLAVTYNIVNFSEVMPDQAAQLAAQTQAIEDARPKTRAEVKMLEKMHPANSAALVEAMRHDVETLVVDQDGIVQL